jgi:uncharacterized flavoprotein (TIGR03862 family)
MRHQQRCRICTTLRSVERDADVLVIGGGPAGLRAAEVAAAAGAEVLVCDSQRSVGRKFLVAGRGGLNLTHGEPVENFPLRYGDEPERWRDLLAEFGPDALREWAEQLGIDSYVGTSGRVFPRGQKAALLLRAWVRRLKADGVRFRTGARLVDLTQRDRNCTARFQTGSSLSAPSIVLALGGASWPETGSDGMWPQLIERLGVEVAPWQPANCGWEVGWPRELLERAEGLPIKNVSVRAGSESVSGELLITRYGLEGGALYRLGRTLRTLAPPEIAIDFKPQVSADILRQRAAHCADRDEWLRVWKLSPSATALLETYAPEIRDVGDVIARVKNFRVALVRPRPIAEAISSAGGIRWHELDRNLMLTKAPGVFVAGEMIDWEAPTGGYLLQGCFATGTRAGRTAAEHALNCRRSAR